MIDGEKGFLEQIRRTADKGAKGVASLSRIFVNNCGPRLSLITQTSTVNACSVHQLCLVVWGGVEGGL